MNEIQVTVRGNVATEPKHLRFDDGNTLTTFRLASNERVLDRERNEWIERATTYVTVNCRRALASNVANSVRKGQPVMVTGRLRERFWTSNERSGQTLVVEAATLGHDLTYGATEFVRIARVEHVRTVTESADDLAATDVTGFTVLGEGEEHDVAGVHDADLARSGGSVPSRGPAVAGAGEAAPDDLDDLDDGDEDLEESGDFVARRADPAMA